MGWGRYGVDGVWSGWGRGRYEVDGGGEGMK